MNKKQKRTRNRILLAIALFVVVYVVAELLPLSTWLGSETAALWVEFALFLVPYFIGGYEVLLCAAKNIGCSPTATRTWPKARPSCCSTR